MISIKQQHVSVSILQELDWAWTDDIDHLARHADWKSNSMHKRGQNLFGSERKPETWYIGGKSDNWNIFIGSRWSESVRIKWYWSNQTCSANYPSKRIPLTVRIMKQFRQLKSVAKHGNSPNCPNFVWKKPLDSFHWQYLHFWGTPVMWSCVLSRIRSFHAMRWHQRRGSDQKVTNQRPLRPVKVWWSNLAETELTSFFGATFDEQKNK